MANANGLDEILAKLQTDEGRSERRQAIAQLVGSAAQWMESAGLEETLAALEQASQTAQEIGVTSLAAQALEQKALLLHRSDRSTEALKEIDRAIDQAQAADEPGLAREFEVRRTIVLAALGRLPEAINVIGSILEELDPEASKESYLRLLGMLGNYHLRSAHFKEAELVFRRALSLLDGDDLSGDVLRSQLGLSQALVGQNKFQEAQQRLLDQLKRVPVDQFASRWEFLRPAIEISHQIEDWDNLVSLTREAIELASRQGDYNEANIHRENLISTLMRLERLEQAKSHLENALDYARRQGPKERKLVHLMNLGRVCFDLGQHEESSDYYQKALEEAKSQENDRAVATITGRLGALMAEAGDLEAAQDLGLSAIERAEAADDPLIIAEQSMLLALTYRDMGQLDQAIEASRRAADLYHRQGEEEYAVSAKALEDELQKRQTG